MSATSARALAVLFSVVTVFLSDAQAAVPNSLSYQGYLTEADGSPVAGDKVITFSIYNVEFGGAPLWSDTQLVAVDQGLFTVELGRLANPFPIGLFSTPLFLGIDVDGDGEMLPRRTFTSVATAFEADNALTLQGQGPAAFDQSPHVADTANPHGVTAAQTGAATAADIASLQSQLDAALVSIGALQNDLASANTTIASLQGDLSTAQTALAAETAARMADVTALGTSIADIEANTVLALDDILTLDQSDPARPAALLTGVNLQVVNGTNATDGEPNGLGNVIVGYDKLDLAGPDICSSGTYDNQADCESNGYVWAQSHKSGSHNLVVGDQHNYSRYGGVIAGLNNSITGAWASILGGNQNFASGSVSSVSGGRSNSATGVGSSVSGGASNSARDFDSSVSGGQHNTADGLFASISGGHANDAEGAHSSVSGGQTNGADAPYSSVSGGYGNDAGGYASSISGGYSNYTQLLANYGSVSGGANNGAESTYSSVSGGRGNVATAESASVSGGRFNVASGDYASVSGGSQNTASGMYASVNGGGDLYNVNGNVAEGEFASVCGGRANQAYGDWTVVVGGNTNTAGNTALVTGAAGNRHSVAVGGQFNETHGQYSVVSGGSSRTAAGTHDWRAGGLIETN